MSDAFVRVLPSKAVLPSLALGALLSVAAGCGDGSGGGAPLPLPTATPALVGIAGAEAAAALVHSTALAAALLVTDTDLSGTVPIASLSSAQAALARDDGARAAAAECSWSGYVRAGCATTSNGSVVTASFSGCEVGVATDRRLRLDGRARFEFPGRSCDQPSVPTDSLFSLDLERFSAVLIDHYSSTELRRDDIDAHLDYQPQGPPGCGGADTRVEITGLIESRHPESGMHLTIDAAEVALFVTSVDNPCERVAHLDGVVGISHHNLGRQFAVTFESTRVVLGATRNDDTDVRLDGLMFTDCVGAVRAETAVPLRIARRSSCPLAGAMKLEVGIAEAMAEARFAASGGVAIDSDADGGVDREITHCGASSTCTGRD